METTWEDPSHAGLNEAPDAQQPLPVWGTVDAHEILRDVVGECRGEIAGKRLDVSLRLLARGYRIYTDPDRLRRVYHHLVKQAIAAAPFGGELTIRSTCPNECSLRLEVEQRSPWLRKSRRPALHH